MCQLTFVNLKNVKLNRAATSALGIINSRKIHDDGVGIFQYDRKADEFSLRKDEKAPAVLENWGEFVSSAIETADPVIMHVRNATTFGSKNIRIVGEEKAHPFESKKLVLAHNGTLELREDADKKRYEKLELIDSEIFLAELTANYNGVSLEEALKKTMGNFYGKFAFMIFDKTTRDYILVRGETKTLFKIYIVEVREDGTERDLGFIINTDKDDLIFGANLFIQMVKSTSGRKLAIKESKIHEIEEESILKFDGKDFKKVGTIKEENRVYVNAYQARQVANNKESGAQNNKEDSEDPFGTKVTGLTVEQVDSINFGKRIRQFLDATGLSLEELEYISLEAFNNALVSLRVDELDDLCSQFIPNLEKHANDNKTKLWKAIKVKKSQYFVNSLKIYQDFTELEFPFFLNSEDRLGKILAAMSPE